MSKKFQKIPNIFPQNPLVGINFLEENDNNMPEGPPNECREQFFKSTGTASDRSSQSFSSKLEKFLKVNIFFRKQTFLEKFVGQVESTFDNFSTLFAPMLQNVLPTVGKQWKNSKSS